MKCPACGRELSKMDASEVLVDACRGGCGGIWFDASELEKLDEPHEHAGEMLLDIERDPNVQVDLEKKRDCPKCDGVRMMRHLYSPASQVVVDECGNCGGIWLDAGELYQIRAFSDEDREAEADKVFSELFGAELTKMKGENEEKVRKAKQVARVFRFVCPTYYIPGRQDWGAF